MATTVLFTWDVAPALRARLRAQLGDLGLALVFPDVDPDAVPEDDQGGSGDGAAEPRPEALRALAADADVLVGWRYDDALLDAAPRCRLCVNPGAGVQHLTELFGRRAEAPTLVNSHGNAWLTAQGAVALLLALAHRVAFHDRRFRAGAWQDDLVARSHPARPLRRRRLGLLGYGHIGKAIHRLLSGWEMDVHALRTGWPEGAPAGVTAHTELAPFLAEAEVLVVALPLTPETEGMLDAEALGRLPA
ncbi:MAG TPA: NAD(P)-dependent oxidoreductase, partial [Polyangiaceae bacterium LLY-WYZ-15_(1-7)]|nr:NAD(P)-dependent oxidoreductase [Polyangiaceae bacterium LLY-WYZ-15_(1-7)]